MPPLDLNQFLSPVISVLAVMITVIATRAKTAAETAKMRGELAIETKAAAVRLEDQTRLAAVELSHNLQEQLQDVTSQLQACNKMHEQVAEERRAYRAQQEFLHHAQEQINRLVQRQLDDCQANRSAEHTPEVTAS